MGVAVGTLTQNPVVGLAAGIVSHLLCDALPHLDGPLHPILIDGHPDEMVWTKSFYVFAIADSLAAMIVTLIIWHYKFDFHFWSVFAWGALGGYLPDLIDNFPLWRFRVRTLPYLKQFHRLHMWIHDNWRKRFPMEQYWPLGIATQIVTVLPCLWYLLK